MSLMPTWLKYLPNFLRAKVGNSPDLMKIMPNIAWLFFDKFLRIGVGLLVLVWVARYLGPQQFGLLSYVTAFVSLFGAIAMMGLNTVVVRDLVGSPESESTIIGSAFVLQLIGGLLAFFLAILAINFVRPDDETAKFMVAVLAIMMVFQSVNVVAYWFESQVESKYIVWVGNAVFLLIAIIKVVLILADAPLIAFIWAIFVEGILVSIGGLIVYGWRGGQFRKWKYPLAKIKALFHDSWPLILSGLAIMVYMRIDQIMLGEMQGDEAVGIYTSAIRISELWYFIPMAIVASVFPAIIAAREVSVSLYYERLQKLFDLMVILALMVAIPVTFLSDWLVEVTFGVGYIGAGDVLVIHIWAGVFVFLGVASSRWFVIEGLQIFTLYRTVAGALLNIGLNLILIPKYGVLGAAVATVVSQAFASVLFNAFNPKTICIFKLQLRSLCLYGGLRLVLFR